MPPPPILFTVAYWAGLATGLLRFGAPGAVAMVALGLGLAWRPLGLLAGGGLLAGRLGGELAAGLARGQCAARLPAERLRLQVRVLEPVDSAGGRAAVAPMAGCRGEVPARWPARSAVRAG